MSLSIRSTSPALLVASLALGMALASGGSAIAAGAAKEQAPRNQANYEAWLSQEVRHQLVMLPYLTLFDNLEYRVDGSTVTLMGQVVNPALKSDAASAVKHIEGVTKVVNHIEVLPPSPMDAQIRRAEYRAIYGYADLWRYAMGALPPVHIVVDMGRVTLYGVVDSQSDKNLIELRAKTVPDVFSVTDDLQVASPGGK
jgi:hyperosmotically inducible periplasmic protein